MSDTPRVLVIPSWYPDDANPTAGVFVAQQVRALREAGIEVAVLFPAERFEGAAPTIGVEDGVTTVRTGWPPGTASSLLGRRLGTLKRLASVRLPKYRRMIERSLSLLLESGFTPDVVHVHALWHAGAAAVIVSDRLGIPFVVTEHSEEYSASTERMLVRVPGVLPLVLRPLARRASAYIAVSEGLAERLRALRIAHRVVVVPNVVPVRDVAPARSEATPHRILHVSQMGPAKNIPLLLESVRMLRQRRADFVLEIGGDSVFRPEAERTARELGLTSEVVVFSGRLSPLAVQTALDRAAFSVMSSTHENSSVFVAESLMAGRPVLTTDCGGHTEYLDETLGRVVASDDPAALADGLDWMLDHFTDFDPQALHTHAVGRFAPDVVAQRVLTVYREVLGD